jgi:hypothetical protein
MTDMLSLFDETTPNRVAWLTEQSQRRTEAVYYFECCGRRFTSWPAFLGHVGPSHPVVR